MNNLAYLLNKQNLGLVGWDPTNMELGEILIIAFTGVVAISTGVYVLLTWRLVSETRRLREVQTEPRVSVRLEASQGGHRGYELVIRNEGQGPAKNVRFEFKGDPTYFRKTWIRRSPPSVDQIPAIKDGLDNLEPGQTFRFFLGTVTKEEFDRAILEPWTFLAVYGNLSGKQKKDTYTLDFSQFTGTLFAEDWLKEISNNMRSIESNISRLVGGPAKVFAVTQTKAKYLKEIQADREIFEDQITISTENEPNENS